MKILNSETDVKAYIQFVASKKRELADWRFMYISVEASDKDLTIDTVEKYLISQVQSDVAWLLRIPSKCELLLFTHKDDNLVLSKFEKVVYKNFSSKTLQCRVQNFSRGGLLSFADILKPHMLPDDDGQDIAFVRMTRQGNCFLILDDDPMAIKQLEKILATFGTVFSVQETWEFKKSYVDNAPDILFLDVHLGVEKGNQILKDLRANIDSDAYVVMISSDTKKELILDIKQSGAKGFVVKPFERSKLYQEIMRAPTITTKNDF